MVGRVTETLYCDGPDSDGNPGACGLPVDRLGKCSTHRKQFQRNGRCMPITVKRSAEEQATDAWSAMLEAADGPDDEYQRLRRIAIGRILVWSNQLRRAAIREGLQRAKRRGTKLGRPRKVDPREIRAYWVKVNDAAKVVRKFRIHLATAYRYRPKGCARSQTRG